MALTINLTLRDETGEPLRRLNANVSTALGGVQQQLTETERVSRGASERMQANFARMQQSMSVAFKDSAASIQHAIQAHSAYVQSLRSIEQAAQQAARVTSTSVLGGRALGGAGAESVRSIQEAVRAGTALQTSLASIAEGERQFGQAAAKANADAAKGTQQLSAQFSQLTGAIVGLFAAFHAAGGLTDFIKDVALTAARTEVLGTVLGQVAKNAGVSGAQARDYAAQVKALGITTQESNQVITRFIQNQLDVTKATDLARVAQNAAAIAGTNSSEALAGLLHGILSFQPEVLRTYGLIVNLEQAYTEFARQTHTTADALTGQQKANIALNEVLRVGGAVAGTYTAAMGDVGKKITSLPRLYEEASNAAGQAFLPSLRIGVSALTDLLEGFIALPAGVQAAVGGLVAAGVAATTMTALVVAGQVAWSALGATLLAFAASPAGLVVTALAVLAGAFVAVTAVQDKSVEATRQQIKEMSPLQQLFQTLSGSTKTLVASFDEVAAKTQRSVQEDSYLAAATQELARRFPELKTVVEDTGLTYANKVQAVHDFTNALKTQETEAGTLSKVLTALKDAAAGALSVNVPKAADILAEDRKRREAQRQAQVGDIQELVSVPGVGAMDAATATLKQLQEIIAQFQKTEASLDPQKLLVKTKQLRLAYEALTQPIPGQTREQQLREFGFIDEQGRLLEDAERRARVVGQNMLKELRERENAAVGITAETIGAENQLRQNAADFRVKQAENILAQELKQIDVREAAQQEAIQRERNTAAAGAQGNAAILQRIDEQANLQRLQLAVDSAQARVDAQKQGLPAIQTARDAELNVERANAQKLGAERIDTAEQTQVKLSEIEQKRQGAQQDTNLKLLGLDQDLQQKRTALESGRTQILEREQSKRLQLEQQGNATLLNQELQTLNARKALIQEQVRAQSATGDPFAAQAEGVRQLTQIQAQEFEKQDTLRREAAQRAALEAIATFTNGETLALRLTQIQKESLEERTRNDINAQTESLRLQNTTLEAQTRRYESFVDRVASGVSSIFEDLLSGTISIVETFKKLVIRSLAEIAADVATRQFIAPVLGSLIGGVAGILSPALGGAVLRTTGLGGEGTGAPGMDVMQTGGLALTLSNLFGPTGMIGRGFTWLTDSLWDAGNSIANTFGRQLVPEGWQGPLQGGMQAMPVSPLGVAGGLAAVGGGIYGAINSSNNAARAAFAASAAVGAVTAAAGAGLLAAAGATAATTGWTGYGLIAAAMLAVIGSVLDKVVKPAGPALAVSRPRGLNITTEGGRLGVQGDLGSQVIRREGVPRELASSVQAQLEAGITNAVMSMVQTINTVALDPAALAGPAQDALQAALRSVQPINSANAKKMTEDITEQVRLVNTQIVAGMLDPLNLAFEQLRERGTLQEQIQRFAGTLTGLTDVFKTLNQQIDELSKSKNTDVLRQLSAVRNRVENFGNQLVEETGNLAQSIVEGLTAQLRSADLEDQVAGFAPAVATMAAIFKVMSDQLSPLQEVIRGIPEQLDRVRTRIVQVTNELAQSIVTGVTAIGEQATQQLLTKSLEIQALSVAGTFAQRMQAAASLQAGAQVLGGAGIDTSGISEQLTRLFASVINDAFAVINNALARGPFDQALQVILAIPDAVVALNPQLQAFKALAQAFAPIVNTLMQSMQELEKTVTPLDQRIAQGGARMNDLAAAIVDAGTNIQVALPLYDQLRQAIIDTAQLEIERIQAIAQAWDAAMSQIEGAIASLSGRLFSIHDQLRIATDGMVASFNAFTASAQTGDTLGAIKNIQNYATGVQAVADLQVKAIEAQKQAAIDGQQAVIDGIQDQIDAQQDYIDGIQDQIGVQQDYIDAIQDQIDAQQDVIDATQEAINAQQEYVRGLEEQAKAQQDVVNGLQHQIDALTDLREQVSGLVRGGQPPMQAAESIRAQIATTQVHLGTVTGDESIADLKKLVELNQELKQLGEQTNQLILVKEALDNLAALQQQLTDQIGGAEAQLGPAQQQLDATNATLAVANAQLQALQDQLKGQQDVVKALQDQQAAVQDVIKALQNQQETAQDGLKALQDQQKVAQDQLESIQKSTYWDEQITKVQYAALEQLLAIQQWLAGVKGPTSWEDQILSIQRGTLDRLQGIHGALGALYQAAALGAWNTHVVADYQAASLNVQAQVNANVIDSRNWLVAIHGMLGYLPQLIVAVYSRQRGGFVGLASGAYYAQGGLVPEKAGWLPLQYARGGMVPVMAEPGERVFMPPLSHAQAGALLAMNSAFPRFAAGGFTVPGSGDGDTVPMLIPSGSFVLNRKAAGTAGFQQGGPVQASTPGSRDDRKGDVHVHIDLRGVMFRSKMDAHEIIEILRKHARDTYR